MELFNQALLDRFLIINKLKDMGIVDDEITQILTEQFDLRKNDASVVLTEFNKHANEIKHYINQNIQNKNEKLFEEILDKQPKGSAEEKSQRGDY